MNMLLRRSAILQTLLLCSFATATLWAQQSGTSSSSSISSPAPAAVKATPLPRWYVEGDGGGSFGPGLNYGQYVAAGWLVGGGGGIRLTNRISIPGNISYYHNPIPKPVLQTLQQTGGNYSFLTFSVDPTFYFLRGEKFGFFALGGGGYSRVMTSFSKPIGTLDCSIYSGVGYGNLGNFCSGAITGSSYSSSQAMYDFGIGMEGRLYPNRREILFVQARYLKLMTPANQLPGPNQALVAISGGMRW